MILPLLAAIILTEKQRYLKMAAGVVAALCVANILFTFSRGGLLTLAVVLPLLIWRSRHRVAVTLVVALALGGFYLWTSDRFTRDYVERAQTISDYQEDRSAVGRLNAWQTSWGVFLDYPLFGVGPNNLEVVYRAYSPEPQRFRVSHNAYLQILCECGLPALVLFLAAIGSGLWSLRRTQRQAAQGSWAEVYARMLQISILAYMIGSIFLSTAYSELLYQLIAMSVSLEVIAHAEAGAEEAVPVPEPAEPWWKQPLAAPAVARRA